MSKKKSKSKNNCEVKSVLKTIQPVQSPKVDVPDILSRLRAENINEDREKKIKLSFEFFDKKNEYFTLNKIEPEWYVDLLEEFNLLTSITKKQVYGEYRKKYEPHPYGENQVNFKDKFLLDPQYESTQLKLEKSTGRLHGFWVGNIYYVRFIDKRHNMYDSKGYPGVEKLSEPLSYSEKIEIELEKEREHSRMLEKRNNQNAEVICDNCLNCAKGVYKLFEL